MDKLRKLVNERQELAEQAARIVELMRADVSTMNVKSTVNKQVVKMTRISDLSPDEQSKVIRIR